MKSDRSEMKVKSQRNRRITVTHVVGPSGRFLFPSLPSVPFTLLSLRYGRVTERKERNEKRSGER